VGVGVTKRREVEIEIRCDIPTGAEIKAVEDFFDWLLAEALRLTGEIGKAA
jgi:glycine cleavage system regulatory protein